jgi:hypothetical protein
MTDRELARRLRAFKADRLRLEAELAGMEAEQLVSDVINQVLECLGGAPSADGPALHCKLSIARNTGRDE